MKRPIPTLVAAATAFSLAGPASAQDNDHKHGSPIELITPVGERHSDQGIPVTTVTPEELEARNEFCDAVKAEDGDAMEVHIKGLPEASRVVALELPFFYCALTGAAESLRKHVEDPCSTKGACTTVEDMTADGHFDTGTTVQEPTVKSKARRPALTPSGSGN